MRDWSEIKVVIVDGHNFAHSAMYVYRESGVDDTLIFYYHPEKEEFEEKLIKGGEKIKPTFVFPRRMRIEEKLTQALTEKGIKPDSNSKNEGMLKATERHLVDLRQMLRLKGDLK